MPPESHMKHDISLTVNGDTYSLSVEPWRTLKRSTCART